VRMAALIIWKRC